MVYRSNVMKTSHGGCTLEERTGQNVDNVIISFDEALKLSLALQSALLCLNAKNRSTKKGKESVVRLLIGLGRTNRRIMIST